MNDLNYDSTLNPLSRENVVVSDSKNSENDQGQIYELDKNSTSVVQKQKSPNNLPYVQSLIDICGNLMKSPITVGEDEVTDMFYRFEPSIGNYQFNKVVYENYYEVKPPMWWPRALAYQEQVEMGVPGTLFRSHACESDRVLNSSTSTVLALWKSQTSASDYTPFFRQGNPGYNPVAYWYMLNARSPRFITQQTSTFRFGLGAYLNLLAFQTPIFQDVGWIANGFYPDMNLNIDMQAFHVKAPEEPVLYPGLQNPHAWWSGINNHLGLFDHVFFCSHSYYWKNLDKCSLGHVFSTANEDYQIVALSSINKEMSPILQAEWMTLQIGYPQCPYNYEHDFERNNATQFRLQMETFSYMNRIEMNPVMRQTQMVADHVAVMLVVIADEQEEHLPSGIDVYGLKMPIVACDYALVPNSDPADLNPELSAYLLDPANQRYEGVVQCWNWYQAWIATDNELKDIVRVGANLSARYGMPPLSNSNVGNPSAYANGYRQKAFIGGYPAPNGFNAGYDWDDEDEIWAWNERMLYPDCSCPNLYTSDEWAGTEVCDHTLVAWNFELMMGHMAKWFLPTASTYITERNIVSINREMINRISTCSDTLFGSLVGYSWEEWTNNPNNNRRNTDAFTGVVSKLVSPNNYYRYKRNHVAPNTQNADFEEDVVPMIKQPMWCSGPLKSILLEFKTVMDPKAMRSQRITIPNDVPRPWPVVCAPAQSWTNDIFTFLLYLSTTQGKLIYDENSNVLLRNRYIVDIPYGLVFSYCHSTQGNVYYFSAPFIPRQICIPILNDSTRYTVWRYFLDDLKNKSLGYSPTNIIYPIVSDGMYEGDIHVSDIAPVDNWGFDLNF